jgi:hypothetical protein
MKSDHRKFIQLFGVGSGGGRVPGEHQARARDPRHPSFQRRLAGHLENGEDGVSDPAMGRNRR